MRTFQSYWSQTGTYLSILPLINMDFDGLRTSIIEMLSGSSVEVNVNEFQNDMVSFADKNYYFKPIRELPTGRGFADFVFIPKPLYRDYYPALLVELKWNKDAETALNQIKERKYPESLQQYTGDILLVGINYDKKGKRFISV